MSTKKMCGLRVTEKLENRYVVKFKHEFSIEDKEIINSYIQNILLKVRVYQNIMITKVNSMIIIFVNNVEFDRLYLKEIKASLN